MIHPKLVSTKDHVLTSANDSKNLVNLLNAVLNHLRAWPTKEFLDEFLVPEDEGAVIEFLRLGQKIQERSRTSPRGPLRHLLGSRRRGSTL
jgi:hypothetical protein